MKIGNRLFPYPMLAQEYSDYTDASFSVPEKTVTSQGDLIQFDFTLELQCPPIEELIAQGSAEYAVHIECPATSYRELLHKRDTNFHHRIRADNLYGSVERTALVVATKDIYAYDGSGCLSPDFADLHFFIPQGGIIAYCELPLVRITQSLMNEDTDHSIFVVYRRQETGDVPMDVSYYQDSIGIGLGPVEYNRYSMLSQNPGLRPLLNAVVVLPALVFVLDRMREPDELDECRNYEWYKTLTQSMKEMGENLDAHLTGVTDTMRLAQMLMKHPVQDAFQGIIDLGNGEEDEES